MMAEELEEIRYDAANPLATNISARSWQSHVRALLAHIDEQAKEIEYWKHGTARGQDTHERVAAALGKTDAPWVLARDMKKENDMLHGQIATLKAALIEQITQDKIAQMGRFGFVLDSTVCDPYGDARKQLAREYPEIAWGEMK
jgi:hypothetical protein